MHVVDVADAEVVPAAGVVDEAGRVVLLEPVRRCATVSYWPQPSLNGTHIDDADGWLYSASIIAFHSVS